MKQSRWARQRVRPIDHPYYNREMIFEVSEDGDTWKLTKPSKIVYRRPNSSPYDLEARYVWRKTKKEMREEKEWNERNRRITGAALREHQDKLPDNALGALALHLRNKRRNRIE